MKYRFPVAALNGGTNEGLNQGPRVMSWKHTATRTIGFSFLFFFLCLNLPGQVFSRPSPARHSLTPPPTPTSARCVCTMRLKNQIINCCRNPGVGVRQVLLPPRLPQSANGLDQPTGEGPATPRAVRALAFVTLGTIRILIFYSFSIPFFVDGEVRLFSSFYQLVLCFLFYFFIY